MKKAPICILLLVFALFGCVIGVQPVPVAAPVASATEAVAVEEPVPEIAFNEPVYYPPPMMVGYPYDSWMYVPNGAFVDLVFIDSLGVRHVEPWHYAGVRMTSAHLPVWHQSYRVPRAALIQHNEKLREYAIKHPGVVKHPPGPALKPAVYHPNTPGNAPDKISLTKPATQAPGKAPDKIRLTKPATQAPGKAKQPAAKQPVAKKTDKKKEEKK